MVAGVYACQGLLRVARAARPGGSAEFKMLPDDLCRAVEERAEEILKARYDLYPDLDYMMSGASLEDYPPCVAIGIWCQLEESFSGSQRESLERAAEETATEIAKRVFSGHHKRE